MWLFLSVLAMLFTGTATYFIKSGTDCGDVYVVNAVVNTLLTAGFGGAAFFSGSFEELGEITMETWICTWASGVLLGFSWLLYFKGLKAGNLSVFLGIQSLSVVFSMILCRVFLGEKIKPSMAAGTLLIVGGIFLMMKRRELKAAREQPWILWSVLSALLASVSYVIVKGDRAEVDTNLTAALRYLIVLAVLWGMVFYKKRFSRIGKLKAKEWKHILLGGALSSAGHVLVYKALFLGKGAVVLTFYRMGMVISVVLSHIFSHTRMTKGAWLGFAVLAAGVILYAL